MGRSADGVAFQQFAGHEQLLGQCHTRVLDHLHQLVCGGAPQHHGVLLVGRQLRLHDAGEVDAVGCSKHKWAPKTYESNLSTIQNLIIPYIGSMEMQKLKPYHMENLYTILSKTPCGSYIEGKKQELTEKQKQRFLSGTTIHEVHRLLGTAFQYAVEWGILVKSPVPVDSPKKSTQERTIWTVEEMRAALDSMEDPILHLAVHLTLVGALPCAGCEKKP